jgi:hypothetical protein
VDHKAFIKNLSEAINRSSAERTCGNTPDFIVADLLFEVATAFGVAAQRREAWYGHGPGEPGQSPTPTPAAHEAGQEPSENECEAPAPSELDDVKKPVRRLRRIGSQMWSDDHDELLFILRDRCPNTARSEP